MTTYIIHTISRGSRHNGSHLYSSLQWWGGFTCFYSAYCSS